MNIYTNFNGNQSKSCWTISVWTKVLGQTDRLPLPFIELSHKQGWRQLQSHIVWAIFHLFILMLHFWFQMIWIINGTKLICHHQSCCQTSSSKENALNPGAASSCYCESEPILTDIFTVPVFIQCNSETTAPPAGQTGEHHLLYNNLNTVAFK